MRRTRFVTLLLLASLAAFGQAKPKDIKPSRWNMFSPEQDVQLGKEAAAEIEKQVQVITNPDLEEYVNRIGKRLAATPDAGKYPYTFKVVNDKSINAFALPGGPAYVHTGLIAAAENEAQIAGVLAHEIGHVALRHGTAQVSKANGMMMIAQLGGAVLGRGGSMLGQLAQMGVGLGANSLLMKFSRDAETDADLIGTRMMAKAGYDPVEMARFFEKLEEEEKKSGRSIPQFLSDHPSPGNRVRSVQNEIKLISGAKNFTRGDDSQLKRVQASIQKLPAPPEKKAFRNSGDPQTARPAGGTKRYQSKGISFEYPDNWTVIGNEQSNELTITSQEGVFDKNGQAEVAYGAIIGVTQTRANSLEQATSDYIQQLTQGNPQMKRGNEQTQAMSVAGSRGLVNVLYSTSAFPNQREVDLIVTAPHPQGLFYMILIAPESEYQKFAQPVFERMIRSLQLAR